MEFQIKCLLTYFRMTWCSILYNLSKQRRALKYKAVTFRMTSHLPIKLVRSEKPNPVCTRSMSGKTTATKSDSHASGTKTNRSMLGNNRWAQSQSGASLWGPDYSRWEAIKQKNRACTSSRQHSENKLRKLFKVWWVSRKLRKAKMRVDNRSWQSRKVQTGSITIKTASNTKKELLTWVKRGKLLTNLSSWAH